MDGVIRLSPPVLSFQHKTHHSGPSFDPTNHVCDGKVRKGVPTVGGPVGSPRGTGQRGVPSWVSRGSDSEGPASERANEMYIPWTGVIRNLGIRSRTQEKSLVQRLEQRSHGADDRSAARLGHGWSTLDPEMERTFLRAGARPTVRR
jgi:hypothetical protein